MDEKDCIKIAKDANIQFESLIDIFYDKHFKFDENESNMEAANQLKMFFPRPFEERGIKWYYNFA